MERFIVRESRLNTDGFAANSMIPSNTNGPQNLSGPDSVYYQENYANEYPQVHVGARYVPSTANVFTNQMHPGQMGQMGPGKIQNISGIDPNYLAAYNQNSTYIATGQQQFPREIPQEFQTNTFGTEFQNKTFYGAERNFVKQFTPQIINKGQPSMQQVVAQEFQTNTFGQGYQNNSRQGEGRNTMKQLMPQAPNKAGPPPPLRHATQQELQANAFGADYQNKSLHGAARNSVKLFTPQANKAVTPRQEAAFLASDNQTATMSRAEKLKLLYKTGPRAFTGPVEKVLKWHKSLQDLGILIIYEIVGKCVSIRAGKSCDKILVVRDDSGPAVQVVYYEVDFLLPELRPPCMLRVVGRMLPGSSRLHAFCVRAAGGDDLSTLPRRAAVAAHHVAKLAQLHAADVAN